MNVFISHDKKTRHMIFSLNSILVIDPCFTQFFVSFIMCTYIEKFLFFIYFLCWPLFNLWLNLIREFFFPIKKDKLQISQVRNY